MSVAIPERAGQDIILAPQLVWTGESAMHYDARPGHAPYGHAGAPARLTEPPRPFSRIIPGRCGCGLRDWWVTWADGRGDYFHEGLLGPLDAAQRATLLAVWPTDAP